MEDTLFTIVIPVYNKEKYLSRCLKSACNQTYKNYEIIVVNDGSTDSSDTILKKWKMEHNRITVINQENKGEGQARNTAIKNAKGDYVLFLDADDEIDIKMLEYVNDNVLKTNADCIVVENYIVTEKRKWIACHSDEDYCWEAGNIDFLNFLWGPKGALIGTAVWNKIMRLSVIRDSKLYFNDQRIGADQRFCLEYAWASCKWSRVNIPLYYYYQNDDSVMHIFNKHYESAIRRNMYSVEEFAKERGVYKECKDVILTTQFRNIFTICNYYFRSKKTWTDVYEKIKTLSTDTFYKHLINGARSEMLPKQYQIFLFLLRSQHFAMIIAMLWLYERKYR